MYYRKAQNSCLRTCKEDDGVEEYLKVMHEKKYHINNFRYPYIT